MSSFRLVLGTRNLKKRRELEFLLQNFPIELRTLDDYADSIEVEETGDTFLANARLKASEQAKTIGEWVLAEDSGLCVAALQGAPGVYSARFSGPGATDEKNNDLLLEKMKEYAPPHRTAWYTCHMAVSDPGGTILIECEGKCHGRITTELRGTGGFGYDPLFELPEYHRTFGELGDAVKSVISHRARAHRILVPRLTALIHLC